MEAAICMMKPATSAKMKRNSCFMVTLGFICRNLAFAPRSTKEVAYKTLVLPKLEYVAPIWSPHSKLQINQIEKVQRTAALWTFKTPAVSAKCLMSLNGHLLRPGGTSPPCFSFTTFIMEQCLLKKKRQVYDPCSQFENYQVIT